jgi:hypothetical protein
MRMRSLKSVIFISVSVMGAISVLVTSTPGSAENTADAIKAFGLIGTWSPDCAADPMRGGTRVNYVASLFGPLKATTIQSDIEGGRVITSQSEIQSAIRVTEEKIKIIAVRTSLTSSNPNDRITSLNEKTETLIQKFGNKIRIIRSQSPDSARVGSKDGHVCVPSAPEKSDCETTGKETPLLEKCLN